MGFRVEGELLKVLMSALGYIFGLININLNILTLD